MKCEKKKSAPVGTQIYSQLDCIITECKCEVIKKYPDYTIYEDGRIWSDKTNKFLKVAHSSQGYTTVELFNEEGSRRLSVHRLVAEAFIPNPNEFPCVNHIDECKDNNHVENLEWCTAKYNINYGTGMERRRNSMKKYLSSEKSKADKLHSGQRTKELLGRKVQQMTKSGMLIRDFASVNEAYRQTGIRHISEACNGKRRTAGGYVWSFKGGEDLSVLVF